MHENWIVTVRRQECKYYTKQHDAGGTIHSAKMNLYENGYRNSRILEKTLIFKQNYTHMTTP